MKNNVYTNAILLVLSILLLILFLREHNISPGDIQKRADLRISESFKKSKDLVNQYLSKDRPEKLAYNGILLFHYRNDTLNYWNDNSVNFDIVQLEEDWFIENRYGKYLKLQDVKTDSSNHIFLLLPLEIKYDVVNDYLKPGLNKNIFTNLNGKLLLDREEVELEIKINSPRGSFYLYDVEQQNDDKKNFFLFAFYLAIMLLVFGISRWMVEEKSFRFKFWLPVFMVIAFRVVQLVLSSYFDAFSFSVRYYSSSGISRSIFDLYLNLLTAGMVVFMFNSGKRHLLEYFRPINRFYSELIFVAGINLFALIVIYLYQLVLTGSFISVTAEHLLSYSMAAFSIHLALVIISVYFLLFLFYFNYYLHRNKVRESPISIKERLFTTLISIGALLVAIVLFREIRVVYLGLTVGIVYMLILFIRNEAIYILNFKSYLFFIGFVALCSLVYLSIIDYTSSKSRMLEQRSLADKLLTQNDYLGESLLDKLDKDIQSDPTIEIKLSNPFGAKQFIQNKIKKYYLNRYFDKYEVNVHVLDKLEIQFENKKDSLTLYFNDEQIPIIRTEYDNLYIERQLRFSPFVRYLKVIDLNDFKVTNANVIIDLKLREVSQNSVIPFFVLDQKHNNDRFSKYSYAIFDNDELIYSVGPFNYEKIMERAKDLWTNPELNRKVIYDDYVHTIYKVSDKVILISEKDDSILNQLSNFGFYFIFMWLILQVLVVGYLVSRNFRKRYNSVSITTKIQLLVNLIIILPLIILSATMINIERDKYFTELNSSYYGKIESISKCLQGYFEEGISKYEKKELLSSCSGSHNVDINLFGLDGLSIDFSQPLLKDRNLYSGLVHQEVHTRIKDSDKLMIDERIGDLEYRALYFPLKVDQKVACIVNIPFFESRAAVNRKLSIYLTRILAIFIGVFFLVTFISYWASRSFTKPLSLLALRLNKVSLESNVPILWESNDEIGMLVKEYNAMIEKLEESRRKLSKQEKESAWKEMAQQVAHEIKNPLTPMRLSLQMLEKRLGNGEENLDAQIKTLKTVISQIDTLNEIAISFASFARMPEPTFGYFDLVPVLERVVRLYKESSDIEFNNSFGDSCTIFYDEKMLSRVVTNIILNGIQASESMGKPRIIVQMEMTGIRQCLISVQDFGIGIPKEVQEKVFVPNFSTKFAGSGIGLALAKNSIEEAGGTIYFETKEGEGTTFFIKLPFVK